MVNNVFEVRNSIVKTTIKYPNAQEVEITMRVAEDLKRKKQGLFQNEVDYRILFPNFKPLPDSGTKEGRYRVDLVGFTANRFIFTEFKIWDENRRTKNPWGVFHFLRRDLRKLEAAVRQNKGRVNGAVQLLVALRNSDKIKDVAQIDLMWPYCRDNGTIHGRKPRTHCGNYFSVVEVFHKYIREREMPWQSTAFSKSGTYFLAADLLLR
jgi:hypothetical protein